MNSIFCDKHKRNRQLRFDEESVSRVLRKRHVFASSDETCLLHSKILINHNPAAAKHFVLSV